MKNAPKDNKIFLVHIIESITDIETFSSSLTWEQFQRSKKDQLAIIKSLEIIGEAVKNLEEGLKDQHSGIPWRQIASFRDILIHEYFQVDLEFVWNVIHKHVPELKQDIQDILSKLAA